MSTFKELYDQIINAFPDPREQQRRIDSLVQIREDNGFSENSPVPTQLFLEMKEQLNLSGVNEPQEVEAGEAARRYRESQAGLEGDGKEVSGFSKKI